MVGTHGRHSMPAQHVDELRHQKAFMPRLDHVPKRLPVQALRQQVKKGFEILSVEFLRAHELPEDRSQMGAKLLDALMQELLH